MRPRRLELEGFTSFRERTTVDFEDADLFVLAGPMGAGKSSIIDALGFALYGSIARFQSKSLVAPVISQGLQQTRVRLDFTLGDKEYTAVRVTRRNPKTGTATTPEARLEEDGKLIAEDAAELSAKVEELLGLNFEQFTRCVVLPQGAFAELLHATPAVRQELLVRLLDIGLYRKVGERARTRAALREGERNQLQLRLDNDLQNITLAAYDLQQKRVAALEALVQQLGQDEDVLQTIAASVTQHEAALDQARKALALLGGIRVPADVGDLTTTLEAAKRGHAAAQAAEAAATAQVEVLEKERAELPDDATLEEAKSLYRERKRIRESIAELEHQLAHAEQGSKEAEESEAGARKAHEAQESEKEKLERADSAYHASRGLKAGDVCPVCGDVLDEAPNLSAPGGLERAEAAVKQAQVRLRAAEQETRRRGQHLAGLRTNLDQANRSLTEVQKQLVGKLSTKQIVELDEKLRQVKTALSEARDEEKRARSAARTAQEALDAAESAERRAVAALYQSREQVAALGAPAPEASLQDAWQALAVWAESAIVVQTQARDEAESKLAQERARDQLIRANQIVLCEAADLPIDGRSVRDAAVAEHSRAEQRLEEIDRRIADRQTVEDDLAAKTRAAATARLLGLHLNASHFEAWYLQEAMLRLVQGATERMLDLSDGQYSIGLNDRGNDFVIVDHINANEQRPVRTLSGGETFLASLALALALGDDIASLAAKGASRLDALFLDEGFGSLDQNTLETVASTIEELGARGRMVGIITHVQELADRVPVQFRVSKINGTSRVERVLQG